MATSYSNTGGSGDRSSLIRVTMNYLFAGGFASVPTRWVDGNTTSTDAGWLDGSRTDYWIDFDFSAIGKVIIDAFKIYGSLNTTQGNWKVLGWSGAGWDELLSSFNFQAGSGYGSPNEITFTNTKGYSAYRLQQISGTTTTNPEYSEIEFKIDTESSAPISWNNTGGTGDRQSLLTMSTTLTMGGGGLTLNRLVDGTISAQGWFSGGESGKYIEFDFSALGPQIINALAWRQSNSTSQGNWRLTGWDGASWVEVMPSSLISGFSNYLPWVIRFPNTTAYTKYRFEQVSGTNSSDPNLAEIEFRLGTTSEVTVDDVLLDGQFVDDTVFAATITITNPDLLLEGAFADDTVLSATITVDGADLDLAVAFVDDSEFEAGLTIVSSGVELEAHLVDDAQFTALLSVGFPPPVQCVVFATGR